MNKNKLFTVTTCIKADIKSHSLTDCHVIQETEKWKLFKLQLSYNVGGNGCKCNFSLF